MSGCLAAEPSDEGHEGLVASSKMMVMEVPRVRYRQAVASAQAHSRERDYEQASNHSPRSRSRLPLVSRVRQQCGITNALGLRWEKHLCIVSNLDLSSAPY